jgi:hypothetical protein
MTGKFQINDVSSQVTSRILRRGDQLHKQHAGSGENAVFLHVISYRIVEIYQGFGGTCCLRFQGFLTKVWSQYITPNRWYLHTGLKCDKSQRTAMRVVSAV